MSEWTPLTQDNASRFAGAQVEVRRRGEDEIRRHSAGTVIRSMGSDWLQIDDDQGPWSTALGTDGMWLVRRTDGARDDDARAFVGELE